MIIFLLLYLTIALLIFVFALYILKRFSEENDNVEEILKSEKEKKDGKI